MTVAGAPTVGTITREELHGLLTDGADIRLVMALGTWAYQAQRIPGSLSFESPRAALEALDPDDDVVIYCSGGACRASEWGARWLAQHGLRRVRRYVGGLQDWTAAGLPVEGEVLR